MRARELPGQERLDCLRLARSEQIWPATYRRLIHRYGSAGEALARLPELAKRGGRARPLVAAPVKEIEAELDSLFGTFKDALRDARLNDATVSVTVRNHLGSLLTLSNYNLGVVELTVALHTVFDFRRDRLVWDVVETSLPALRREVEALLAS